MQDQLLDTWSRERRTVIFITHDVDEAVYLANRVIVMAARPGRLHEIIDVDLPYPRTEEIRLSPGLRGDPQPASGTPFITRTRKQNTDREGTVS